MWRATVLTIFPEMFPGPLAFSLAGRALQTGLWSLEPVDIREFATDRHRSVDDTPAGGGPGMVMKPDVLARALDARAGEDRPRLLMSPRGGVMGKEASGGEESFTAGLLEYPQYTRPQVWEGRAVPDVLLSGDHAKVAAFRRSEAERLTRERRPDLWAAYLDRIRRSTNR